jgi:phage terminase large subunit GpA-like protein
MGEEYYLLLTAEQLITTCVKGYPIVSWVKTRDKNEAVDCI